MAEQEKTPVTTEAGTDNQPEGSAPSDANGHAQGETVESALKSQETGKKSGGVLNDLFKAREKKREAEAKAENVSAELEAAMNKIAQLEDQINNLSVPAPEEGGALPQAGQQDPRELARQAAQEVYKEQLLAQNEELSAASATEWLRTRSHLASDPNAQQEIADMIIEAKTQDEQFGRRTDHRTLAKAVYVDWCANKGISPDLNQSSEAVASRASADVSPSASGGSGGPKTFTPSQVDALFKGLKPGSEEYKAALAEVRKAQLEGRIKA